MPDAMTLAWRQFRMERRMFWRNPTAAFFNFILPLLFLALFGALFSGSQDNLEVIVPGIAGMSVMASTFSALAMNLTFLREQGVLKRMRGTPLPTGSYLAGLFANAVANVVVMVVVVVVCGRVVFGLDWPPQPLSLVVFVVVGVVSLAALGVAFSHVIPNFDAAPAYVNFVFLPVLVVSGVFYDSDEAPAWLVDVAQVLPLTHLIDGLSAAMVTGGPLSDGLGDLAVLALWGAAGIAFAVRGFRWE